VSFDPTRDPPARMAALRASLAPRGRWRFATTGSEAAIAPVLADFGQDGAPSHVLKIFLVDADRRIRNIYSTGFLDVRLMLADLETILAARP
jgi:cytochrome oxidase Cu insertion factor (SCO1/SenC/PrrC family)